MTTVEDVADAYVWGYPLVTVHRVRSKQEPTRPGSTGLAVRGRLSTAADRAVVAPNNDTLYASGWFDLARGDVVVEVAAMDRPDRYWSVMLLDAYTNVAYVCRRLHGHEGTSVRVTYDPAAGPPADAAQEVVPLATRTLWVLARVVVDGPGDLDRARDALSRITVGQPAAGGAEPPAQGGAPGRGARPAGGSGSAGRGGTFLDELGIALALDPPAPWQPPLPAGAARAVREGAPARVLAGGIRAGEERILRQGRGVDRVGNGWGTRSRGARFGDDVTYRAAFAKFSLAGHLPAENRSYTRIMDGSRPAVLRFPPGGEPPVDGFWSLSLYGTDMFFVDNEISRFSIGDRTPDLRREADGTLAVTISHARPAQVENWLPAAGGPCVLVLRAYEGRSDVVDARWFPPDLEPGGST